MSRLRLILLSVLSVLALSAVASASASAAACKTKKTEFVYCNAANEEIATATNVTGKSGTSVLSTEVGTEKLVVTCTEDTFTGTVNAKGTSTATITFENCTVTTPSGCSVESPIKTKKITDQLNAVPEDVFTGAGSAKEFATIKNPRGLRDSRGRLSSNGRTEMQVGRGARNFAEST